MRKVKFKKWIPGAWVDADNKQYTYENKPNGCGMVVGTNKFQQEFETDGVFHMWANEAQDNGDTMVMDTLAIVETSDGLVHMVSPCRLMFLNPIKIDEVNE